MCMVCIYVFCFDVWLTRCGMIIQLLFGVCLFTQIHMFLIWGALIIQLFFGLMSIQRYLVYIRLGVCVFLLPSHIKVASGNLERSYRRAPKGAKEAAENLSGAGICHLCLGGKDFEWENLFLGFVSSFFIVQISWTTKAPYTFM